MIDIRPVQAEDIPRCGEIMYLAFKTIADQHNFPADFPNADVTSGMLGMLNDAPVFDGFVAEDQGSIEGSIFVSRRSPVGGISVITVDPDSQNRTLGRQLMNRGMACLADQGHTRQQLIQAGYHSRSLCLYAKLGFIATDLLSTMAGDPIKTEIPGHIARPATPDDADACNALCRQVHGFDRAGEVSSAIAHGTAAVVESDGGISGYTTGVGFAGHGVGASNEDLKALIASVDAEKSWQISILLFALVHAVTIISYRVCAEPESSPGIFMRIHIVAGAIILSQLVCGALGDQGLIQVTYSLGLFWLVGVGGWLFYLLAVGVRLGGAHELSNLGAGHVGAGQWL